MAGFAINIVTDMVKLSIDIMLSLCSDPKGIIWSVLCAHWHADTVLMRYSHLVLLLEVRFLLTLENISDNICQMH